MAIRVVPCRQPARGRGARCALRSARAAQKTQLMVYTALETDQLKAYQEGFDKANPTIEINWVRDSTGVITAKLLAEKANPQADVVMGVAATSLAVFDGGRHAACRTRRRVSTSHRPQYRDPKNPPSWVGMDVWGATICFNTVEAAKRNLPKPETWKDLTKPVYKGQIVMPNPASSGTGFFDVTGWLQIWGEAEGWKYMDGLHQNIAQYMHSGSRPCAAAANGEYVIGISFEYRANHEKAQGKPIDLVFPKEGLGWDLEAFGIIKGTKNLDAAKKLLDWASRDAGDGAVREELRDRRGALQSQAAAERAGRLREPPGQERFRVGGEEPRPDPRRVDRSATRRRPRRSKPWAARAARGHDSPGCSRPAAAGPGDLSG